MSRHSYHVALLDFTVQPSLFHFYFIYYRQTGWLKPFLCCCYCILLSHNIVFSSSNMQVNWNWSVQHCLLHGDGKIYQNNNKKNMGVPNFMEGSLIPYEIWDPGVPKILGNWGPGFPVSYENGDPGSPFSLDNISEVSGLIHKYDNHIMVWLTLAPSSTTSAPRLNRALSFVRNPRRALISAQEQEDRRRHRNESDRARRAAETAEQRSASWESGGRGIVPGISGMLLKLL